MMKSREDVLKKIRALLAKAESTTYEAEADAFNAKAQELMLEFAVDEVELEAAGKKKAEPIVLREVTIKQHQAATQNRQRFLNQIAEAFGCRMFIYGKSDTCVVAGYESDTMFVELLYLSVNVQCYGTMNREVREAKKAHNAERHEKMSAYDYCYEHDASGCDGGPKFREAAFRRGFSQGYFNRVGERIKERYAKKMEDVSESTAIVLRDRGKEVDDWMLDNGIILSNTKARQRDTDWAAAHRGREKGDDANIGMGEEAVTGSSKSLPA